MDNNLLLIDSNFLGNDIVITGPPEVAKAAIAGRRQYIFIHFQCMFADRIHRFDPLDQTDSQTVDMSRARAAAALPPESANSVIANHRLLFDR